MSKQANNEWMSISDMMSGLMLIFLFIAISYMVRVEAEKQEMKDIALEYRDTKADLNEALFTEFEKDFKAWDATVTTDNAVVFSSPEVLFAVSKSEINNKFKTILDEFFVRYLNIISSAKYRDEIEEIRVEGYTSRSWKNSTSEKERYLKNMKLSQERAYNVLSYCYNLDSDIIQKQREWLEQHLRANGMAFAKPQEGEKARRVEFRILMKSEERVDALLQ